MDILNQYLIIINCIEKSESIDGIFSNFKNEIDDYRNILSLIIPYAIKKTINIALIGPKNSGKTTLIKILNNLRFNDCSTNLNNIIETNECFNLNIVEFNNKNYYNNNFNCIFVISDINKRIDLYNSVNLLINLLEKTGNIPILYIKNKIDEKNIIKTDSETKIYISLKNDENIQEKIYKYLNNFIS